VKVSIITVSYNSAKTIRHTIESVLNQKYENIEYIVVDGYSRDETVKILSDCEPLFMKKAMEFRWISEKDDGIYDAINKGIRMATGDVVGILNSDDYFQDDRVVGDIVEAFMKNDVDCIHGNLIYINPNDGRITRRWISREFSSGLFEKSWTPAHPTFYCKREVYNKYGLYKTDYRIAADVELMYRFLEINRVRSKFIDRKMVVMRQGGISNRGLRSTITITKEMRRAFRENGQHLNLLKYLFFKVGKLRELV